MRRSTERHFGEEAFDKVELGAVLGGVKTKLKRPSRCPASHFSTSLYRDHCAQIRLRGNA
jgi:hypothetical protein